jgi:hypothetical protein
MVERVSDQPPWSLHFGVHGRRIILAGHSHVLSVMQALGAHRRDDISVAYSTKLSDGPPFDDQYWRWIHEITTDELIAVMWNGNQHHASFLVQPEPPIVVWGEGQTPSGLAGSMIVPRTMLEALWEPTVAQLRFTLDLLCPDRRVVLLGTPPPKRQDDVLSNLATEVWFREVAGEMGVAIGELPVTDESDRLNMWTVLQQILARIAVEYEIPFVPSPAIAADSGGYLLRAFSDHDATHANAAYGDAVCDALEELLT